MSKMSNALSWKTEIFIVLSTAYFNLSIGLLIIILGLGLANTEWYKFLYVLLGLLVMSYPFFHLKDRLKDRKNHVH